MHKTFIMFLTLLLCVIVSATCDHASTRIVNNYYILTLGVNKWGLINSEFITILHLRYWKMSENEVYIHQYVRVSLKNISQLCKYFVLFALPHYLGIDVLRKPSTSWTSTQRRLWSRLTRSIPEKSLWCVQRSLLSWGLHSLGIWREFSAAKPKKNSYARGFGFGMNSTTTLFC